MSNEMKDWMIEERNDFINYMTLLRERKSAIDSEHVKMAGIGLDVTDMNLIDSYEQVFDISIDLVADRFDIPVEKLNDFVFDMNFGLEPYSYGVGGITLDSIEKFYDYVKENK